ncbi:MOSC domain-containing protein [Mucilaginibacter sp. KACC 22063]|uniref:MOSC domain-containing protein n=1 Tax=Mucilaginibacter sp. KACC 22063 TaxID=3025666 RepID=UPI0023662851|nr:MOSC N-terminal beta barrel domain-containing protein [Mucilaginibacter sp. KACC 22063]WDF55682.1 MOSC N-terminal beta barrel domain-containing protein [Mucilaginibacter sp. KACC 22063]
MLQVSQLFIYPVKSLGGIAVTKAQVTDRGLMHDRRWMLIDNNNRFLSQREHANMALFNVAIKDEGLLITYQPDGSNIIVPFQPETDEQIQVTVWDDTCVGIRVSDAVDQWFTAILNMPCRMVYMPDVSHRNVDPRYALDGEVTSFADAYPFLLIGQSSLDELNSRLEEKISIDRFRPNIVFTGGEPFQEDEMKHFAINGIHFYGVKLCARCVMVTINQQTAAKGTEPLKTLAKYRFKNNKILFGQNLLHKGEGELSLGNTLQILA